MQKRESARKPSSAWDNSFPQERRARGSFMCMAQLAVLPVRVQPWRYHSGRLASDQLRSGILRNSHVHWPTGPMAALVQIPAGNGGLSCGSGMWLMHAFQPTCNLNGAVRTRNGTSVLASASAESIFADALVIYDQAESGTKVDRTEIPAARGNDRARRDRNSGRR